jgi:hypothetical protein
LKRFAHISLEAVFAYCDNCGRAVVKALNRLRKEDPRVTVLQRLRRLWLAVLSLICGAVFAFICIAAAFKGERLVGIPHLEDKLGAPRDYLPAQSRFVADGDYNSVIALGDFAKENPTLPHAAEILALRDRAE